MRRASSYLWARMGMPARLAFLRSQVGAFWRMLFAFAGRYARIPDTQKQIRKGKAVAFKGDIPPQILGDVRIQHRMHFREPRPLIEAVDDLVVTPDGGGWKDGCLFERYSASTPGLRMLMGAPVASEDYSSGYFVQSAHCDTYGDWVSEYLVVLSRAAPLDAPLFLPAAMADRYYVKRDLAAFGIDYRSIAHAVRIRSAKVLRQQKFFVHFPREDVKELRRLWRCEARGAARAGSVVYLSRRGEQSEVAMRQYPNEIIEAIVKRRGGRVLRTSETSPEEYARAAEGAETVIFDHGSAFYNALHWPVRRAVEIVSDAWWNNAFLMLADAMGVHDYTIIRGDCGEAHVTRSLEAALDAQIACAIDGAHKT